MKLCAYLPPWPWSLFSSLENDPTRAYATWAVAVS
jgi:hypothetical protein